MKMGLEGQSEASGHFACRPGRFLLQLLAYEIKFQWEMVAAAYHGILKMRTEKYAC